MSGVYGVRRVAGSTSAGGSASGGWRHSCRAPIGFGFRHGFRWSYSGAPPAKCSRLTSDFSDFSTKALLRHVLRSNCSGRHPARLIHVDRCTTAGPHGRVPRHAHAMPARIHLSYTRTLRARSQRSARAGRSSHGRGTRILRPILRPVGRSPASPPGPTHCARPPGGAISRSDHTRHIWDDGCALTPTLSSIVRQDRATFLLIWQQVIIYRRCNPAPGRSYWHAT
jgi:hypothetical protein